MTLAAAGALGVVAGIVFAWLWLWIVPWAVHGRFWPALSAITGDILRTDDPRAFLRLYRGLLAAVARYVGRNLGGALLASLPVLAILFLASRTLPGGEVPFFVAFTVAMIVVFLWPATRRS